MATTRLKTLTCGFVLAIVCSVAQADPWFEVGDRTLRSDLEVLEAAGLIDAPLTTWPIPASVFEKLSHSSRWSQLPDQPLYVQEAAARVLRRLHSPEKNKNPRGEVWTRASTKPDVVRDFGTESREKFEGGVGVIEETSNFSGALRVSSEPRLDDREARLGFDGSYLNFLAGNWQLYGGWIEKWYGPGEVSSLTLSNNARPTPKIGLMRNDPHPFDVSWAPWLSYIGPWQFDTFLSILDGPATQSSVLLAGARLTIKPLPRLELGISRLSELCGSGHTCDPLRAEFNFEVDDAERHDNVNDQGTVDFKYAIPVFGQHQLTPYAQFMNEEIGPFTKAAVSHLFGSTLAGPVFDDGMQYRVSLEYTDSVARENWFDFGKKDYGAAYTSAKYPDGLRYRDRTLGFSLDSDSRLLSLVAALIDTNDRTYRFAFHRAQINQAPDPYQVYNIISGVPVTIDEFELGMTMHLGPILVDTVVRDQDRRLYARESKASAEVGLSYHF
jgi:hypothetical protein